MIMCYLYQTVRHVIMLALLTLVSISKTEQLVMLMEAAVYYSVRLTEYISVSQFIARCCQFDMSQCRGSCE